MSRKNSIAFFDFDGTVSKNDSMIDFIIKTFGFKKYIFTVFELLPTLLKYKAGLLPNQVAKQVFLSNFFSGMAIEKFNFLCNEYYSNHINSIINPAAMEKILWHKNMNHLIVIVTASIENWLEQWCKKNRLNLIGTKLELKDGKITKNIFSKNCFGPEKVSRIKSIYDLSDFSYVYAYGDSKGDKEMLEIADYKFYKCF